MALGIKTPIGYVVHTGDFKIDCTPIMGRMWDLARLGEIGNAGVLALLADSTNAERPGYTPSERVVGDSFANLFKKAENKRIIIATFSSNLHRIQQIIDAGDERRSEGGGVRPEHAQFRQHRDGTRLFDRAGGHFDLILI